MEDTHGGMELAALIGKNMRCLNPYYNGRYSWSQTRKGSTKVNKLVS